MLMEYTSSGNGYPNPIDAPDSYPCFYCGEECESELDEYCSKECEYEHKICQEEEIEKAKKENDEK